MDINDLTIREIKEISSLVGGQSDDKSFFIVGQCYLIRTVTMINVGRVVAVNSQEIELEGASWIPSTERYYDTLKDGDFNEVEPYPDGFGIVGRGAIIDAQNWNHDLPSDQK